MWISEAWNEVPAETIRKCFSKAGVNVLASDMWSNDVDEPAVTFDAEYALLPPELQAEFCKCS